MAVTSLYKAPGRQLRNETVEVVPISGMKYTDNPLTEGFAKMIVNCELDSTNGTLSPRKGIQSEKDTTVILGALTAALGTAGNLGTIKDLPTNCEVLFTGKLWVDVLSTDKTTLGSPKLKNVTLIGAGYSRNTALAVAPEPWGSTLEKTADNIKVPINLTDYAMLDKTYHYKKVYNTIYVLVEDMLSIDADRDTITTVLGLKDLPLTDILGKRTDTTLERYVRSIGGKPLYCRAHDNANVMIHGTPLNTTWHTHDGCTYAVLGNNLYIIGNNDTDIDKAYVTNYLETSVLHDTLTQPIMELDGCSIEQLMLYELNNVTYHFSYTNKPREVLPSEALNYGYNMLKPDPYSFHNVTNYSAETLLLEGILPYVAGKLTLSARTGQELEFQLFYKTTQAYMDTTIGGACVQWEISDNMSDGNTTVLQSVFDSPVYKAGDEIKYNFKPPYKTFSIIVKLFKHTDVAYVVADNTLATRQDKFNNLSPLRSLTLAAYTLTDTNVTSGAQLKRFNIPMAKGMCTWQQRLVVWGVPNAETSVFTSDLEDPTYFPYPNGYDDFGEEVRKCVPYLDQLLVFTSTQLYLCSLDMTGLYFTKKLLQVGLNISDGDVASITTISNMVHFKSGNYYFLVVPRSASVTGELQLAPISNTINGYLDKFHKNTLDLIKNVYHDLAIKDFVCTDYYTRVEGSTIKSVYKLRPEFVDYSETLKTLGIPAEDVSVSSEPKYLKALASANVLTDGTPMNGHIKVKLNLEEGLYSAVTFNNDPTIKRAYNVATNGGSLETVHTLADGVHLSNCVIGHTVENGWVLDADLRSDNTQYKLTELFATTQYVQAYGAYNTSALWLVDLDINCVLTNPDLYNPANYAYLDMALCYSTLTRAWCIELMQTDAYRREIKEISTINNVSFHDLHTIYTPKNGATPMFYKVSLRTLTQSANINDRTKDSVKNIVFDNRQYLDTGNRSLDSTRKKRFRELQFCINNTGGKEVEIANAFFLDEQERRPMYAYELQYTPSEDGLTQTVQLVPSTNIDNIVQQTTLGARENNLVGYNVQDGSIVNPDTIEHNTPTGTAYNLFVLDTSKFKYASNYKLRIKVSGKGYLPKTQLLIHTTEPYNLTGIGWVYRSMNQR